jgi:DNA-binding CsgD family transcriptional regulator
LRGDISGSNAVADVALECSAQLGHFYDQVCYGQVMIGCLTAGDAEAAWQAAKAAERDSPWQPSSTGLFMGYAALAALRCGDSVAAQRLADDAVAMTRGVFSALSLAMRSRVALECGDVEAAVSYAHTALEKATAVRARVVIPDILELLAQLLAGADGHAEAARLLGAADALRASINIVRFKVLDPGHAACVSALRDALGDEAFDQAWADGSALSIDEATAYAQRGRGERKRPTSGWASLTPTERDVVRLVGEGLSNKDVAARLFVSPRTVESHLSHVYTKLGLSSRVQLAQEAARHAD